jgi:hypothetical protein
VRAKLSCVIKLGIIFLVLVMLYSNISSAKSEDLYTLLNEKEELLNENLAELKGKCPLIISLFKNQNVAIYADDQIVGLILCDGKISDIIRGEPEDTTVDIYADMETIENIKTADDFLRAWREDKIKVVFRNQVADNPIVSSVGLIGGAFAFCFFYYFTGNYYSTKRSLIAMFSNFGLIRKEKVGVEREISTERMLFSILGWEGKGYKPRNDYARLLIGHSYLLNCRFTPLKEFKRVKIKLRYDETKLKIDDIEHDIELPESKTYHISTKIEGLPEMQTEATDFILIDAEWKEGKKEEGVIKIPIAINRYICDGVSYSSGSVIKWAGGITAAVVVIANAINPLINGIMRVVF